jgi:hypothetical protein
VRSIAEHPPTPTKGAGFGTEFFKIFGAQPKKATTRGALKPATYDARFRDFLSNFPPDGQAPKRRGPKPDSKPALTRRQELNRQAQR